MSVVFDDEFVAGLAAAADDRPEVPGMDAVVQFVIGKKAGAVARIAGGRVVGVAELDDGVEPDAQLVFTAAQAEALVGDEATLEVDYMRGDFKPTGSTRAIAAALLALR